jgi:hypothetical protein
MIVSVSRTIEPDINVKKGHYLNHSLRKKTHALAIFSEGLASQQEATQDFQERGEKG